MSLGPRAEVTSALLVQSAIIGVSIGSIYILMALGLTLMFGMMHIINFAHGAVYMLGAFVIYYVFFQSGVPYFAAFLLAMILLGAFGYLIERGIYRPIKGGIEPTLVALLALTTFLQAAGYPVFGQLDKHVPPVFAGTRNILGVTVSVERLMIIPIAGALVVALYLFINKTRLGGAMRAIEQDKEAAALQGVNVDRINGLAFGVGFALAAAAGALMAPIFKLDPMMGEQPLLKAFIIIILGGLGSIPGAILGGLMLGLIDSIVATALGAEPAFLLSFVFIILVLLFKPTGLFGYAVR
jgi:branched-chain amino acid transport system permease protein